MHIFIPVPDWRERQMGAHGHAAADFLKFTGTWCWLVAVFLAAWATLRNRSVAPMSDLAAYAAVGMVVIARFMMMANHSQIHTIFVNRYLFLFLAMAWSAIIWFAWSLKEKHPMYGTSATG